MVEFFPVNVPGETLKDVLDRLLRAHHLDPTGRHLELLFPITNATVTGLGGQDELEAQLGPLNQTVQGVLQRNGMPQEMAQQVEGNVVTGEEKTLPSDLVGRDDYIIYASMPHATLL